MMNAFPAILLLGILFPPPQGDASRSDQATDFVQCRIPDGWHDFRTTRALSRLYYVSPDLLSGETFAGDAIDVDVLLTVQMDQLQASLAEKNPRDLADYVFLFKVKLYGEAEMPLEMSQVEPRTIDGIDGFECLFDKDDGDRERTFVGRRHGFMYVVNFSYNADRNQKELELASSAIASVRFPDLRHDGPIRQYVTDEGDFAVELPEGWHAKRVVDGKTSTYYVTREELSGTAPKVGVGLEIMKWLDYSHDAPADLSGTDEKTRDSWFTLIRFIKDSETEALVEYSCTDTEISDLDARRLESSRPWKDGSPAIHSVDLVAAKDDTLVHARFRCPESEWPIYQEVVRHAEESLQMVIGRSAVPPWIANTYTGRYGDALLMADRLAPQVPGHFIPVRDPAPGSTAGWQTEDSVRRLMLQVVSGTSAKEFIDGWRKQLPKGVEAELTFKNHLDDGVSEAAFQTHLPNGRDPWMWMRAIDVGDGRLFWLNATLYDKEEWIKELEPVYQAFIDHRSSLTFADGNSFEMNLPGTAIRFKAPKEWKMSLDLCREVVSYVGEDGQVSLSVSVPDEERSYVWQAVSTESLMESLARAPELEEKADRRLSGGKDKRDRDRIYLITQKGTGRRWVREQTRHVNGLVVTLKVSFVSENSRTDASAARRAAPIFTSWKVVPEK
ncbi:MAG: hypothetical protein V2A76_00770 [Planctomycetota bacterium]